MRTLPRRVTIVMIAALTLAGATLARTAEGQDATPIFLALPESYPDVDARVVLVREPGREIVVLDPAAGTADELAVGLRLLARLRRDHGEPQGSRGQMIPVVGFAPAPRLATEERARLEALIAQLRGQPLGTIGQLGRGRWLPYREAP